MRRSEDWFAHRLRKRRQAASLSRSGLVLDFVSPITKHPDYSQVPSTVLRSVRRVFVPKPATPLNIRVNRALESEALNKTDADPVVARHSATFLSTSREYLQRLIHPQAPPLGSYNPQYRHSMKLSPSVAFPKAESTRNGQERRALSEEPRIIPEVPFKPRCKGLSFDKQTNREPLSSTSPHEARFASPPGRSSPETQHVHSFASYSRRRDLFPLPIYQPDYSPRYSFLSRRKIPA